MVLNSYVPWVPILYNVEVCSSKSTPHCFFLYLDTIILIFKGITDRWASRWWLSSNNVDSFDLEIQVCLAVLMSLRELIDPRTSNAQG